MAIVFLFAPFGSAVPSGLTYMDSTWSHADEEPGTLIAINPNETILASVHNNDVILYDIESLEKIETFTFNKISAIEFSPNGTTLAVNKAASVQVKESIKLIDIHTNSIREHSALADDRAADIAWSPDGQVLAAPGPEGDVELYRYGDLSLKVTLHGVHNVDVTCIDYRADGEYLITGDESGRYAIWNKNGVRQNEYRGFEEDLVDCKFSPDGLDIILLGDKGKLMSESFAGAENHNTTIEGAKKIMFSDVATRMQIAVESDDFRGLISYDYDAFSEIKRTTFFHKAEDIEYIDDEFGRLQKIFASGGTGEVAVYLRESIPDGFNQPGADLDGDTIPDNLDPDDDGDGIIDDWDNDIGCDAPEGTPCSRYPDISKIRQVDIDIGSTFLISDTITLPTEYSSHIRNLSRIAIAADQILSSHEVELFAEAMCANIDHSDVIEQWRDSISLSNGELGIGTVTCILDSGMELIKAGDSTTQIKLTIITEFEYDSLITFPLEISLDEQTLPTDGSIAWLAPAHPMSVSYSGKGAIPVNIPLWWNNGDIKANATLVGVVVDDPTILDSAIAWALHPVAFVLYLGIIAGIVLLIIRRDNAIDLNFDDEEEEEFEEHEHEEENADEDDDEDYEQLDDSDSHDMGSEAGEEELVEANVRTPPAKKRKMYTTTASKETLAPKKRRVSTSKETTVKTKRKRLVSDQNTEPVVVKRRNAVPSEKVVKKRRVKTSISADYKEETETEIVKPVSNKKKRKSVKRKKKSSEKTKDIDENSLQGDLVSDFLSED